MLEFRGFAIGALIAESARSDLPKVLVALLLLQVSRRP